MIYALKFKVSRGILIKIELFITKIEHTQLIIKSGIRQNL